MTIYQTNEYKDGKQSYHWFDYRLEGSTVVKYRCQRRKFFDGYESNWDEWEDEVESWDVDDEDIPEWLLDCIP